MIQIGRISESQDSANSAKLGEAAIQPNHGLSIIEKNSWISNPPSITTENNTAKPEKVIAENVASKGYEEYLKSYHYYDGRGDALERWKASSQLVKEAPDKAYPWFVHGFSCLELAKETEDKQKSKELMHNAIRSGNKAISFSGREIDSSDMLSNTYTNIGAAHFFVGEYQEAERFHRTAIEINSNNVTAWCNIASTLYRLGRKADGLAQLRKGHEINPLSSEIIEKMKLFLREEIARKTASYEAIDLCDELIILEGERMEVLLLKSIMLQACGRNEQAKEVLLKAEERAQSPLDRVECTLFTVENTQELKPQFDLKTDSNFQAAWVIIEETLEKTPIIHDENHRALYLASMYHGLLGDLAQADSYRKLLPEECAFRVKANSKIFSYFFDRKVNAQSELAELDSNFDFLLNIVNEQGDDVLLKDLVTLLRKSFAIGEDWDSALALCDEYKLRHSEGLVFALASGLAAHAYDHKENYVKAEAELQNAFKEAPIFERTYGGYFAYLLARNGKIKESMEWFRKDQLHLTRDVTSHRNLIIALTEQNLFPEAYEVLTSITVNNPSFRNKRDDIHFIWIFFGREGIIEFG